MAVEKHPQSHAHLRTADRERGGGAAHHYLAVSFKNAARGCSCPINRHLWLTYWPKTAGDAQVASCTRASATPGDRDRLDDIRRQLNTARKQLSRLPDDAAPGVKDRASEKVAQLTRMRDEHYTEENGIGRRNKAHRSAEAEGSATEQIERGLAMAQRCLS